MLSNVPTYYGHVNGNRFLLLDLRTTPAVPAEYLGKLSSKMCETSCIDDLIVIEQSAQAKVRIRVFGGDGKEADFCGNGVLFTLSLLAKEGPPLSTNLRIVVETASGIKRASVGNLHHHSVDIAPIKKVPFDVDVYSFETGVEIYSLRVAGEPHLLVQAPPEVAQMNDDGTKAFERFARRLFAQIAFPGGINITAICARKAGELWVKTFERGVERMTASCGTGAVAAASYFLDREAGARWMLVNSPGGRHLVQGNPEADEWWLSGEAKITAQGNFADFIDLWWVEEERGR